MYSANFYKFQSTRLMSKPQTTWMTLTNSNIVWPDQILFSLIKYLLSKSNMFGQIKYFLAKDMNVSPACSLVPNGRRRCHQVERQPPRIQMFFPPHPSPVLKIFTFHPLRLIFWKLYQLDGEPRWKSTCPVHLIRSSIINMFILISWIRFPRFWWTFSWTLIFLQECCDRKQSPGWCF